MFMICLLMDQDWTGKDGGLALGKKHDPLPANPQWTHDQEPMLYQCRTAVVNQFILMFDLFFPFSRLPAFCWQPGRAP
jgi:hypothetical protein